MLNRRNAYYIFSVNSYVGISLIRVLLARENKKVVVEVNSYYIPRHWSDCTGHKIKALIVEPNCQRKFLWLFWYIDPEGRENPEKNPNCLVK